jgi:hypothetical protein
VSLLVSLLQAKQFLDVRQRLGDLLGKPVRILQPEREKRKSQNNKNTITIVCYNVKRKKLNISSS